MTKIPIKQFIIDDSGVSTLETLSYWKNFLQAVRDHPDDKHQERGTYDVWCEVWKFHYDRIAQVLVFDAEEDAMMFLLRWS